MRLIALLFFVACGAPELERTELYAPDGSFLGGCTASSDWCVVDTPDGGAEVLGAP